MTIMFQLLALGEYGGKLLHNLAIFNLLGGFNAMSYFWVVWCICVVVFLFYSRCFKCLWIKQASVRETTARLSSCIIFYMKVQRNNLYYISDFIYAHRRVLACDGKKYISFHRG